MPGALEGGGGPARGAAGVLVVGGWWMLRRLRGEAPVESGLLWPFRLSGLAAVMGMVLAESLLPGAAWGDRGGEAALLGMLHLGLPLAMHGWWTRGRAEGKGPSLMGLLWLSLGGMVSVLPLLQRHAGDAALLAFCPLVWLGGLLGLRAWQPRWDAAGGALAGAVMGVAAVAAWCRPGLLLPEVPLISWLNVPAGALSEPLARPFLNPAHFILLLLLGSAGALLGALVFRARGGAEGLGVPLLAVDARVLAPGP